MWYRFLLVGEVESSWQELFQRAVAQIGSVEVVDEREAADVVAKGDYDLVVVDAGVIGNAAAITSWLRAQQPRLPIVVATASPTWQRARQMLKAGATDYIRKTMDEEEIRSRVRLVLDLTDEP